MNTNSSSSPSSPIAAHEHHHDHRNRFIIGAGIVIVLAVVIGGIYLIYAKRERAFNEYYDAKMSAERDAAFKQLAESDAKPLSNADRNQILQALQVKADGNAELTDEQRVQIFQELQAGEDARRGEIRQEYKDSK